MPGLVPNRFMGCRDFRREDGRARGRVHESERIERAPHPNPLMSKSDISDFDQSISDRTRVNPSSVASGERERGYPPTRFTFHRARAGSAILAIAACRQIGLGGSACGGLRSAWRSFLRSQSGLRAFISICPSAFGPGEGGQEANPGLELAPRG